MLSELCSSFSILLGIGGVILWQYFRYQSSRSKEKKRKEKKFAKLRKRYSDSEEEEDIVERFRRQAEKNKKETPKTIAGRKVTTLEEEIDESRRRIEEAEDQAFHSAEGLKARYPHLRQPMDSYYTETSTEFEAYGDASGVAFGGSRDRGLHEADWGRGYAFGQGRGYGFGGRSGGGLSPSQGRFRGDISSRLKARMEPNMPYSDESD